jgi:2-keto-4-pentenoate hydratase/2-oxohepta-3-ene-1,7-dioic acid hydratase in catechol pathway
MKLIRFGERDREKPGIEQDDGSRLDVSDHIPDYTPDFFACGGLERLKELAAKAEGLPAVPKGTRLGPPIARPYKFLAVGLNYRAHAEEGGHAIPSEPLIFTKATSCIMGPDDDILVPRESQRLDYEVELAFVMKDKVRYLEREQDAPAHIAGFTICNDVSERHFQQERGGQFIKGKSCDTFGPLGPVLVTTDALPDHGDLELTTRVNGEVRQHSTTADLIFSVPHLVWYLSQFMTLEPGDVIATGTPSGVGSRMDPPGLLQPGDKVELSVAKLGTQTQTVRAP